MKWLVLWIISLATLITAGVMGFLPVWGYLLGAFWMAFTTFLLIWFWLAPQNYFFTFVKESTAKIVVRGDAFSRALIQWKGYTFNDKWDVVPSRGRERWHPLGGLRFYGIWPIWDILIYTLRWHDLQRTGGGEVETPVFHEEVLDYVLLRPDVYWTKVLRAETGGEERIPLDVEFLTTMKVVNPYKVIFVAPISWVENVLLRLAPIYRGLIASKSLDELLALKGKGEQIQDALMRDGKFNLIKDVLEQEWGIKIEENGIQIKDIDLPKDYQDAAAAQRRQQLEAGGRAAEAIGTVISMMAQARGKTEEEIKKEINRNKTMRREFLDLAKDLAVRKLGIEGRSYLDIRVQGAKGLERMILNSLAAWQRMPGGEKKEE